MNGVLHIDFETHSVVDLPECGVDVYAENDFTLPWCMGYAFGDGPVGLWKLGEPLPQEIIDWVKAGKLVAAHNAAFEWHIWNKVCVRRFKWPWLTLESLICTMAKAYAMGLPGSLEKAAAATGMTHQKDLKGSRVMMQLAQPRDIIGGVPVFYDPIEHKDKFEMLYNYCRTDIEVERELDSRLVDLSEDERKIWLLDQKINLRGVGVDLKSVRVAEKIVALEKDRLNQDIREATGNQVATFNANAQLTKWLNDQGVATDGVAKADVIDMLDLESTPPHVQAVLKIRQEAAKSSNAKISKIISGTSSDGRIRGMFQYHGAATGRWAGRRTQLHNLPRPNFDEFEIDYAFKQMASVEDIETLIEDIDLLVGPATSVVSDCIRGFFIPKAGHDFIVLDFSAIEARVLAWLAGEERVLKIFRGHGKIYEQAAADIFGISIDKVTKPQRSIGKVAILALGYGGGKGAFQVMSKGYGVKVTDDEAEGIKIKWREANPNIVNYWASLERAALDAVAGSGVHAAGPRGRQIKFRKSGSFLWCQLPGGRVNCYPYPKIEPVTTPWGATRDALTYMAVEKNQWVRVSTYGGSLSENVTQSVARNLLAESMLRLEASRYPVVMHIHDEVVLEVPIDFGSVDEAGKIMSEIPSWGEGLPIHAEGFRTDRYQKK